MENFIKEIRMKTFKRIAKDIDDAQAMKGLLEAYEEMAATKMISVRDSIGATRQYYKGLTTLSDEVGADLSHVFESSNEKEAVVLLSANEGLYGDILDKVFAHFVTYIQNNRGDVYIAGEVGEKMLTDYAPDIKYTSLPIADSEEGLSAIESIRSKLLSYKNIKIFYGEFASIVNQNASMRGMSGAIEGDDMDDDVSAQLKYLYEPSLAKISKKFGEEIFIGIWEQTAKESQLAQQASRLMHLDSALTGLDSEMKKLTKRKFKMIKKNEEKKQSLRVRSTYVRRRKQS